MTDTPTPTPDAASAAAVNGALVQQLQDVTSQLKLANARNETARQMLSERDGAIINLRTDLGTAHAMIADLRQQLVQKTGAE